MRSSIVFGLGVSLLSACASSSSEPGDSAIASDAISREDSGPDSLIEVETSDARDGSCTLHQAYSSKNVGCNDCAQTSCCDEVNGCFDDPRCNDDYVDCILACALLPDDAGPDAGDAGGVCLADCATRYPAGKAAYDVAIGCVDDHCSAACD